MVIGLWVFAWWWTQQAGGRAYSVHEVARAEYLFRFLHHSAKVVSLQAIRCRPSGWKFPLSKTDKWPVSGYVHMFTSIWLRTLSGLKEYIYLASLQVTYQSCTDGRRFFLFLSIFQRKESHEPFNFFFYIVRRGFLSRPNSFPLSFIFVWTVTFLSTFRIEIVSWILWRLRKQCNWHINRSKHYGPSGKLWITFWKESTKTCCKWLYLL